MEVKKHTKEARPLVRCPKRLVGKWGGYDIILKSHEPTADLWEFDKKSEEFRVWLSDALTQR